MVKYSLIIPCYNESKNIIPILERVKFNFNPEIIELIIVDNGSNDDTELLLLKNLQKYPFATSIRIPINKGYGNGILEGLKKAKGEIIGWTHADQQTDLLDALKGFDLFKNKYKNNLFVKGTRKGRNFFDSFFTLGMSLLSSIMLNKLLWDINAQPNIFHRSFLNDLKKPPKDFSFDLYVLYKAAILKKNIVRIPVKFSKRLYGESKWNIDFKSKFKFIIRNIRYIFQLFISRK
tara:strand:- start:342 stop:1043 length:702 start_codon:yes stop_codon:yes gene_type:complete